MLAAMDARRARRLASNPAAGLAAALVLAALPAAAQAPADGKPPVAAAEAGWTVSCQNRSDGLACRALHTTLVRNTRQRLLSVIARVAPPAKRPEILLHLPHGLFHPAGVTLQVDERPARPVPIQTCDASGCLGLLAAAEQEITAMQQGRLLTVAFQNTRKQTIRVEVPLAGFGPAWAKVLR